MRRAAARAAFLCICVGAILTAQSPRRPGDSAVPADSARSAVLVVETSRGTFSFETFPGEAPLTVAHVTALAAAHFYDGQRVHRAIPGFVVQFGDPRSRDLDQRDVWGRGSAAASGTPIGVAELSKKRLHQKGAVGVAHMGNPSNADSQIYITLEPRPDLDGRYVVFGQVISGEDVLPQLRVGDTITRVFIAP